MLMKSRAILNYCLFTFFLLTIVIYYLGESGKVNNFPTYVLGLLALFVVITRHEVRQYFVQSRILQLSSLLLCYFALSSFWSTDLNLIGVGKAWGNVPLLLGFLLSIVICCRTMPLFLPVAMRLLVLSACVSAVFSIYLYYSLHLLPFIEDRIYAMGRLGSPVMSALSYGIASLIALHLLLNRPERTALLGWTLVELILLFAIVKTGTISVWLGLVPAWIVLLGMHFNTRAGQLVTWLVMALVAGVGCIAGLYYGNSELFTAMFPRVSSYRPEIWSAAISLTLDHNLLLGFGHLDSGNLSYAKESFHHAHSIYVASFYYGGLVGLLMLLALVVKSIWLLLVEAFKADRHSDAAEQLQVFSNSADIKLASFTHRQVITLALTSLVFGCVVFLFDGDRLLEKVDLIWMVFWLPVGLSILVEINSQQQNHVGIETTAA